MTILLKSCRWGSTPPTIIPYFSTVRNPGVVFLVPAIVPFHPVDRAISRNRRDLYISSPTVKAEYGSQGQTYTVAIPLHLAKVLRATLSPNKSCLAFPRTIATLVLVLGGTTEPSDINHSTLGVSWPTSHSPSYSLAAYISHDCIKERHTRQYTLTISFIAYKYPLRSCPIIQPPDLLHRRQSPPNRMRVYLRQTSAGCLLAMRGVRCVRGFVRVRDLFRS